MQRFQQVQNANLSPLSLIPSEYFLHRIVSTLLLFFECKFDNSSGRIKRDRLVHSLRNSSFSSFPEYSESFSRFPSIQFLSINSQSTLLSRFPHCLYTLKQYPRECDVSVLCNSIDCFQKFYSFPKIDAFLFSCPMCQLNNCISWLPFFLFHQ